MSARPSSSLSMIVRADDGGLGNLTRTLAAMLHPDRVVAVTMSDPRGANGIERVVGREVRFVRDHLRPADVDWLCATGTVLSVETLYVDTIAEARFRTSSARIVVYAMPELFGRRLRALQRDETIDVWVPTVWEMERCVPCTLVSPPVDTSRVERHIHDDVRTVLHLSSPAMLDRNGTDLVMRALDYYDGPELRLLVGGWGRPDEPFVVGPVEVEPVGDVGDWWERWTPDIDLLVQPRRYGGLSLPVLEAAAAGIPTLALDRSPERHWPCLTIPAWSAEQAAMKGGTFDVWDASPAVLAAELRRLATGGIRAASMNAAAWADRHACPAAGPTWTRLLHQEEPG